MAVVEQRLQDRITALLNAANPLLDDVLAGAAGARNFEIATQESAGSDERRVPGRLKVSPGAPEPLDGFGRFEDAERVRYPFVMTFTVYDDLNRQRHADKVYQAVRTAIGSRRAFFTGLSEPENRLLVKDGEIELEPELRESRGSGTIEYTITLHVTVVQKKL